MYNEENHAAEAQARTQQGEVAHLVRGHQYKRVGHGYAQRGFTQPRIGQIDRAERGQLGRGLPELDRHAG